MKKSRLMLKVEEEYKRPLERLLPELVNEIGLSAAARQLGVSNATVGYWLLKMNIQIQRVAVSPGETLEIKRQQ